MTDISAPAAGGEHSHVFLGHAHDRNERRAWLVIGLCSLMMVLEIVGGLMFGSIALVADGLHMSTHAGALLLAALAYTFARKHARDPRFTFGTGKFGDLAGFASATILAMIALLIGWEAVTRFFAPVPIRFDEAIPIACLGLAVNIASAWLLGGGHDHGHGHGHGHGHHHHGHGVSHAAEAREIRYADCALALEIFEDGVPPRFRLRALDGALPERVVVETVRPDGSQRTFELAAKAGFLESLDEVPEPHAFTARVLVGESADGQAHAIVFSEDDHGHAHHHHHHDNNMRAAVVHVMADAAVSVLVIVGLLLARQFGWRWTDPAAGVVGAVVIAAWSWGLIRDTGAILLDMNPDRGLADRIRRTVEADGDRVADLHLWRLGPGHLGAILAVQTSGGRDSGYYRARLSDLPQLSHLTVEVVVDQP